MMRNKTICGTSQGKGSLTVPNLSGPWQAKNSSHSPTGFQPYHPLAVMTMCCLSEPQNTTLGKLKMIHYEPLLTTALGCTIFSVL